MCAAYVYTFEYVYIMFRTIDCAALTSLISLSCKLCTVGWAVLVRVAAAALAAAAAAITVWLYVCCDEDCDCWMGVLLTGGCCFFRRASCEQFLVKEKRLV